MRDISMEPARLGPAEGLRLGIAELEKAAERAQAEATRHEERAVKCREEAAALREDIGQFALALAVLEANGFRARAPLSVTTDGPAEDSPRHDDRQFFETGRNAMVDP